MYNPVSRRGLLRYVAIRVSPHSANKALVTLVTTERNYREMTHLAKWLKKKVPQIIGVHQNINASTGNVIFGAQTTVKVIGAGDLVDQVGDIRSAPVTDVILPGQQPTSSAHLQLRFNSPGPISAPTGFTAVDLYCGVGGIAMHLATSGAKVTGIEINEDAIFNAKAAAELNELGNCRFNRR